MSILNTKPANSYASKEGWRDKDTHEILVNITHMVQKMEAELVAVNAKLSTMVAED